MLTLFFGHSWHGLWRQWCSATLPRGPDRVSEGADGPCVGRLSWGCLRWGAWPGALEARWSGVPGQAVTGQLARIVGKRLVDGFLAIRQAFFNVFDNVA